MVAYVQRWLVLTGLTASMTWMAFWWSRSQLVAAAGVLVLMFAHSCVLAMEFIATCLVNSDDSIPRASAAQCARAWLAESCVAPRVFCWQQPFRSQAIPDHLPSNGRRGAVLIHGLLCNRGFWNPWLRDLRAADRAFIAVSLEPIISSIDDYVTIIERAIVSINEVTGKTPILICHSMGGLAARAWLRDSDGARVHRIVTLGTPHRGAWLARFGGSVNSRQLCLDSEWLRRLNHPQERKREVPFTCWHSNCDNIVFPASTATLPGADNRLAEGRGHVEMAFDAKLRQQTLALLDE